MGRRSINTNVVIKSRGAKICIFNGNCHCCTTLLHCVQVLRFIPNNVFNPAKPILAAIKPIYFYHTCKECFLHYFLCIIPVL